MGELTVSLATRGLMIAAPGDMIPEGFLTNALNMTAQKQGYLENRRGTTRVSSANLGAAVHSQGRMIVGGVPYAYQGAGTSLFRAFTSIATGFSGSPFIFRDLNFELSTNAYIAAFDSAKRVKDSGVAITNFGLAAPTAVASAVQATAQTKTVDTFEYATNGAIQAAYPTSSATITTTATAPAVGTYAGNLAVAASTTGYATRTVAINLSQFSAPGDSDDDDPIVFWFKIDVPSSLVEVRLMFDVDPSTNDFAHNYYWKSIQSNEITPAVDAELTAQTIREQVITQAAFEDPEALANLDERINQLLAEELASGTNQWQQFFVRKSDFQRVGTSANNWANVAAVRIYVKTNAGGAINLGIDSFYMQGGTAYRLNGDYDWISQYENDTTKTRSPFYQAMAAQVAIDHSRATVTVTNPTDTQVSHIRLYRRGGDFPEDYLLVSRTAVATWSGTVNITDGVADSELGEVADFGSGSDLVELSNAATTEIEPTVMEMHMERAWVNDTNYPDRLWYSDRGNAEMFREDHWIVSKAGPGDPIVRPFALDDQMFIFTAKTVKRLNGSGPESFDALNTGAEMGLFTVQGICRGENKIFYRTYDGIYMMTGSGYPTKITGDIDTIFHGQLLDDDANLVAIDNSLASTERLEYFDSKLHFSYTGTNGARYEFVRDFETNRWEQTNIGATSYLRLDDQGQLYVGGSDGYVYIVDDTQHDADDLDIAIDFRTRYFDFGAPDREKFITSIAIDCDLGGGSITAYLDLNNGDSSISQTITNSGRSVLQFPMTEEVRAKNWAFRVTGDNGGVRMRFYKVTIYYEMAPNQTRRIDSYELDFGWTRWKFIRRLWLAGRTDGTVTVDIYVDGQLAHSDTFSLSPAQGWEKVELKLPPGLKGKLYRFIFTSDDEFQLFLDQSDVEWHPLNGARSYDRARLQRVAS